MNYKGQTTNRWKMSALVVSLSALVLVTLAAYAPADVAAADIAFLADSPMPISDLCSDSVAEKELDRSYGTFAGVWTGYLDCVAAEQSAVSLAANPEPAVADRNYGTYAGVWTGYANQVITANSNPELDRNYGTYAGIWTGYLDQVATHDPNSIELDRNYGTFAGVWTGYLDQVATQSTQAQ